MSGGGDLNFLDSSQENGTGESSSVFSDDDCLNCSCSPSLGEAKKPKLTDVDDAVEQEMSDDDMSETLDFSEEYDTIGEDDEFANSEKKKLEEENLDAQYPFEILSTEQIVHQMVTSIREVSAVLNFAPRAARLLLTQFGWDKDKLLEAYFGGKVEHLIRDPVVEKSTESTITDGEEVCQKCHAKQLSSLMYGMECEHRFCHQCWSDHLTTKIVEGDVGHGITCACHNCPIFVEVDRVMQLVTDPQVQLKYQRFTANCFVQVNPLMRWCPTEGCSNVISVEWKEMKPVTCKCGHKMCAQCGHEWHEPVTCVWLEKALKIFYNEPSEDNMAALKYCPTCDHPMVKEGTWNHVVCKTCDTHFCWKCLEKDVHCNHKCDFNEFEVRAVGEIPEILRSRLYRKRYFDHKVRHNFEQTLYDSVKQKLEKMFQNVPLTDLQLLKMAVDDLCKCRQTLAYTNVFAFHLNPTNHSDFLEDELTILASETEKLAAYIKEDVKAGNWVEYKIKIHAQSQLCENARQEMLNYVNEGCAENWWTVKTEY